MTTSALILVGAAAIQFLFGSLAYVRDTLHGRSQPNRMTFLIWAIGPFIAVAAGLSAGGSWALVPVFMSGFGPFCIFLASYANPKAHWKLGTLDYLCGALAILALVLWALTSDPVIAIIFAIAADTFALYPTLIKAWKYPETETGITYIIALLNASVGLILATQGFSEVAFLTYLVLTEISLIVAIYRKRVLLFLRGA